MAGGLDGAPVTSQSNPDGDTLTAAFSRHAASSADITRVASITVRRSGTGAPRAGLVARCPAPVR